MQEASDGPREKRTLLARQRGRQQSSPRDPDRASHAWDLPGWHKAPADLAGRRTLSHLDKGLEMSGVGEPWRLCYPTPSFGRFRATK